MRLRVTRITSLFFAVPLLTAPLLAQDAVTRVSPVPGVAFRGAALPRDMNLRESSATPAPSGTTTIIRPGVARASSAPLPTISRVTQPEPPTLYLQPATPPAPQVAPAPRKPATSTASKAPAKTGKAASTIAKTGSATKSKSAPAIAKVAPSTIEKPAPPTIAKASTPSPVPARSVLSPRNDPPLSALPPGGRDLALQPTTFTPYDRYLGSVHAVISNLEVQETSMMQVARLMKLGHRFKYCVCDPYRADPPAVTEARRAGDCKSKALWLYSSLGDSNALFVIGKAEKRARNSHAWVYWRYDERWWILDCTENSDPIAADSVSSDRYVPYYSFGKAGAFRHNATRLILTGDLPAAPKPVAGVR